MIDVRKIVALQTEMVERWHQQSPDNPVSDSDSLFSTICQQHQFNFLLWHEEDIARSPCVGDAEVARVKRAIDRYNQQRNDWIEKVDDEISKFLDRASITLQAHAPLNTETAGSTIDRLSILSLRIYHLREQLDRPDVDSSHVNSVQQKLSICLQQQEDLTVSLQQLITAIFAGVKRHRTYRQLKMYNDPNLNPYLYNQGPQRKSA